MDAWNLYTQAYVIITLGYLWYRFLLLFFTEAKQRSKYRLAHYDDQLITVIIPYYNEDLEILERAVDSVVKAIGNKQVIVVDDGSPDLSCHNMLEERFGDRILLLRYEPNQGKRHAQQVGFEHSRGEFVVTVDSDTIIDHDALIRLIQPLVHDDAVGAATGNVHVLNEGRNMLTKMVSARYWNAFNVERKSLSQLGVVTCCSGVLSAYRSGILSDLMERYVSQKFLGETCTYGDDRHLTNLVLMKGYKIEYVEDAHCYTESPTTMRKLFKQQLRWKKSFLRESLISLSYAFSHSIILPIEVLFNLLIPFWSLFIRIALIASMILNPTLIPVFMLSVATVAVIRNWFLFFEDRRLALYSIPYAFLHEMLFFWLYFIAAFSLKEKSWGTR